MRVIKANERSISFKKSATKTSIKHNNREFDENDWNTKYHKHIDREKSGSNQYLVKKNIHEMYDELFGEAVEEYNAKQKRNDRKIEDYFSHVNKSKTLELQREFIVQIGDMSDFENEEDLKHFNFNYFSDEHTNKEVANEILKQYVTHFEERNPNLKIYNAVIHNDEASPHLHLNVIPIAEGYKRGVNKQPSFDKALKQQGITPGEDNNIFKAFRDREIKTIEKLMHDHGLNRKQVGTNRIHDVREYKKIMNKLGDLQQTLSHKQEKLDQLETSVNVIESRLTNLIKLEQATEHRNWDNLSDDKKIELAKPYFPNPLSKEDKLRKANKILELKKETMNVSDLNLLSNDYLIKSSQDIEQAVERGLEEKIKPFKAELEKMQKENTKLSQENKKLQQENKVLKKTVRVLENAAREFIEKTANRFKHAYFSILGRLSFDNGIKPKIFSPTSKSNAEAFKNGYREEQKKSQKRSRQDRGLEL